jgi:prevent-host-death family protein
MIATLRETKTKLSEMVLRAAGGEEILITVRGKPKARLTGVGTGPGPDMASWPAELKALHKRCGTGSKGAGSREIIDALREERA